MPFFQAILAKIPRPRPRRNLPQRCHIRPRLPPLLEPLLKLNSNLIILKLPICYWFKHIITRYVVNFTNRLHAFFLPWVLLYFFFFFFFFLLTLRFVKNCSPYPLFWFIIRRCCLRLLNEWTKKWMILRWENHPAAMATKTVNYSIMVEVLK